MNAPKGMGTMPELARRTGLSPRYLYRLRERGVFRPARRVNGRVIYYDLRTCERAVERYLRGRAT